jgi:NAD(P)-dependent dehydrogenase (short-subunit alcohol dehydrogenase family)
MKQAPTILITGGASGLGRAIAEAAAARGYRVAIADIHHTRGEQLCESLTAQQVEALFIECDVRDEAALRRAVERVVRRWQQLDVMVNAAGVAVTGLFEAVPAGDWDWLFDVNVMGTVRGCRAALSVMRRQRHGHLINIASINALAPRPALSPLAAAEGAIVNLSESLYSELAPDDIAVTVLCPGFYASQLADNLRAPDALTAARFERLLQDSDTEARQVADTLMAALPERPLRLIPDVDARRTWRQRRWWQRRYFRRLFELARRFRR